MFTYLGTFRLLFSLHRYNIFRSKIVPCKFDIGMLCAFPLSFGLNFMLLLSKVNNKKMMTLIVLSFFLIGCGESEKSTLSPQVKTTYESKNVETQIINQKLSNNLNEIEYASISELSEMMEQEQISSHTLVKYYLNRVALLDKNGPAINAIIELNPDALSIADQLDLERKQGKKRGPLHGIPVLLKDNIDTGDKMQTTAGSLAMIGFPALKDAFLVKKLRDAGAIILGKTNLSEWSYFRDSRLPSGWSGRGGQTKNPYLLKASPCGSSSGSAAAVATGFAPISVGTETDGSIICPAEKNGVVGIRPTLGFISRSGIIPISTAQDTAGPIAKNVRDATLLLNVMLGTDASDQATRHANHYIIDFSKYLKNDGLKDKRIGYSSKHTIGGESNFEKALAVMRNKGAILVSVEAPQVNTSLIESAKNDVFDMDFRRGINAYLSTRQGLAIQSLSDLIIFNKITPGILPDGKLAQQDVLEKADQALFDELSYQTKYTAYKKEAQQSIDNLLKQNQLDALVGDDLNSHAAAAGYPGITIPSGMHNGLPTGLYFVGPQWSEGKLLSIAYSYEQATQARQNPTFSLQEPTREQLD